MRATGYTGGDVSASAPDSSPRAGGPGRDSDWLHTNGLDWLASHDLIVLSVRHMDEIWVIDPSTTTKEARGTSGGRRGHGGGLLTRYGNPKMYGAGTAADRRLFRQHDATWIGAKEGGLLVLVFNNGAGRSPIEYSSVDEVLLPFDVEHGFGASAELEPRWQYTASDKKRFYSSFISGAQRLSNGHTLVCSGTDGRIFEVERDGKVVFEYLDPHGGDIGPGPPRGASPAAATTDGVDKPAGDGASPPRGTPPSLDARGARSGVDEKALFRATHIALDHPGVARLPGQPK